MFGSDMGELMKQAKDMQKKLQDAQKQVVNIEVTGESGAGLVKVSMNGKCDVKKVDIDTELLTGEKAVLEELIAFAINDAVRKVEREKKEKLGKLSGNLGLPEGMKMPF